MTVVVPACKLSCAAVSDLRLLLVLWEVWLLLLPLCEPLWQLVAVITAWAALPPSIPLTVQEGPVLEEMVDVLNLHVV